jgi:dTDP-4-dehydrorhamnose reductase
MNKYKILILGTTGMLGNEMYKIFLNDKKFDIFKMNRKKSKNSIIINIEDQSDLINKINLIKPDYVINCIGWIKQKSVNNKMPYIINSQLPLLLSQLSLILNFKLIHISTDCVFTGKKGNYLDNDKKDAKDLYGLSKNLGEVKNLNTTTFRTSIIGLENGTKKYGLLEWFLSQKINVKGFDKVFFSGLTTLELSKTIKRYIFNKKLYNNILNVSSKSISKFELLNLIKITFNKDVKIIKCTKTKLNRTLNSNKFKKITGYKCPSWKKMLNEMHVVYKEDYERI